MKRSWTLWLVFAGCAAIVIAALAWVSFVVLRLEEAGTEARKQALLEENTRLALWRMETMLAPLVAQENARPYYSYQAFFPAERAYTRMLARLEPNEILIPSPLLTETSPYVLLYFQTGPGDELSSPQIPSSSSVGRAIEGYSSPKQVEEYARRLRKLGNDVPRRALLDAAPSEWLPMERLNGAGTRVALPKKPERPSAIAKKPASTPSAGNQEADLKAARSVAAAQADPKMQSQMSLAQDAITRSPVQFSNQVVTVPQQQGQITRNEAEYQARVNTNLEVAASNINIQRDAPNESANLKSRAQADLAKEQPAGTAAEGNTAADAPVKEQTHEAPKEGVEKQKASGSKASGMRDSAAGRPLPRVIENQAAEIKISLLKAVWIQDALVLVRRVRINRDEYLQGCWLDWPRIQDWLAAGIRDLFPRARLEAKKNGDDQGRSLVALPLLLQPGPSAVDFPSLVSPLKFSLWVAWLCVITAILATAVLLWGTHALSERRAAFVSAVTHELRTPLTTFRLYAEMLYEGMVPGEEQKRQYLGTLKQEADRQYHLIENVLAYSRMEKGRFGGQKEDLCLGTWLERIQPSLAELAERSAMTLVPAEEEPWAGVLLRTDAAALERILFNLVDNACKYARAAVDKRIHIEVALKKKQVLFRVRDHGPGIAPKDVARLFQPFRKSARDAANSAPGVGLGLALCRRLARRIGGELSLEQNSNAGAAFSLRIPVR